MNLRKPAPFTILPDTILPDGTGGTGGTGTRTGRSIEAFQKAVIDNLYYTQGSAIQSASRNDIYMALAYTVRDHLIERWAETTSWTVR